MAYTRERLERAKAAFPLPSKSAPPSEEVIKEVLGPRYNLRPRDTKSSPSKIPAWVDNEKDKDYKPTEK